METTVAIHQQQAHDIPFHFERSRLNALFTESTKCPLVLICAGSGYGKTSAVLDFIFNTKARTAWIQLSERDNVATRFWENYSYSVGQINQPLREALVELGFPDTDEKMSKYFMILHTHVEATRRIVVFDDFHLIENPAIINFVERCVATLSPLTSFFLISRSVPPINIASLIFQGQVFSVSEQELRFTNLELTQYFKQLGLHQQQNELREIMEDTGGWAFAINLIMRSYRQAPGYKGYLRNAMMTNVFQLMDRSIFSVCSEELKAFLVRLSLIDHLSVDLIAQLAKGDEDLIAQLDKQNAYVRKDAFINAYLIHHLFREFLSEKQALLTPEQKRETYAVAAEWCKHNGFRMDALVYYEKIGDYQSIVSLFLEMPTQLPLDIALHVEALFSRAPTEAYDQVDLLAMTHVRVVTSLGHWQEALELMEAYEARYLRLPEDSPFRNHALGGIYFCWGNLRMLMSTTDNRYDFDQYFAKQDECLSRFPFETGSMSNHPVGPWVSLVGTSEAGAPQEYIEALTRAVKHVSHCFNGAMSGLDELAQGELLFYQGDFNEAEPYINRALKRARMFKQYDIAHHALFFALRCAFSQCNWSKTKAVLSEMEALLNEEGYENRFINQDIIMGWYYCFMGVPELTVDWLKEGFVPYGHTYFIENFGNLIKAHYCYETRNYMPLLSYLYDIKQRESILFGRVEMLVLEACAQYKLKNRKIAFTLMQRAYRFAAPNGIIHPFIKMGKSMRTLSNALLKETQTDIPHDWLVMVNHKSAAFAKCRAHLIAQYKLENQNEQDIALSPREMEVLVALSHGLSRSEIAVEQELSVNTVKMVISNIYAKVGVESLADLIRFAVIKNWV